MDVVSDLNYRSEKYTKRQKCTCCGKVVSSEEEAIFPISKRYKPGFIWAHYSCVEAIVGNLKDGEIPSFKCKSICKHWAKRGFCSFGKGCFFAHPTLNSEKLFPPKVPKQKPKRKKRGKTRREGRQRPKVANTSRASILRRFFIGKIGKDRLNQGSGILDVAGGKGELAFEFKYVNGIDATVVDPRPMLLQKFRRRYRLGLYHRNPAFLKHSIPIQDNVTKDSTDEILRLKTPVKHLRLFFDDRLFQWMSLPHNDGAADASWYENSIDVARTTCWTSKGLTHEDDVIDNEYISDGGSNDTGGEFKNQKEFSMDASLTKAIEETKSNDGDGEIVGEHDAALEALLRASAVVGMHPDQAAEHICDFALKYEIPFAVVPCCVYSKQFPKRKLPDGTLVKSYEQLLQHLQSKDRRIRKNRLPFEGKNIVLWFDPLLEPLEYKRSKQSANSTTTNAEDILEKESCGDGVSSLIYKAVVEEIKNRKRARGEILDLALQDMSF
eukprot:g11037.t1